MARRKIEVDPALVRSIGQRLQRLRVARRLSQAELAARVGIEPETLSRLEGGRRPISTLLMLQFAKALDIDPGELLAQPTSSLHAADEEDERTLLHAWRALDPSLRGALLAFMCDLAARNRR